MKKAQAAIEFLTTYGWAFIIILVAFGAFSYYFGFDTTSRIPNMCNFGTDFSCGGYLADESGVLVFELNNNIGKTINVSYVRINLPDGRTQILQYFDYDSTNQKFDYYQTSSIPPGGKLIVRTYPKVCDENVKLFDFLTKKEKFSIQINYIYANELDAFAKTTNGEIIVDIFKDEINTTSISFNNINESGIIMEELNSTKWVWKKNNCDGGNQPEVHIPPRRGLN